MRIEILFIIALALIALPLFGQKEKPRLEIDYAGSLAVQSEPDYRAEKTADGFRFHASDSVHYDIRLTRVKPLVQISATGAADGKFRYSVFVVNARDAVDPIRYFALSFRRGAQVDEMDFDAKQIPDGWKGAYNVFRGEIKPGGTGAFSIVSSLKPADALIVLSGIDHETRVRERNDLLSQGVSIYFFRWIARQIGTREYSIYTVDGAQVR